MGGSRPVTESKGSHNFATQKYVALDHFSQLKMNRYKFFDSYVKTVFLNLLLGYVQITSHFGSYLCRNTENSNRLTNF